MSKRKKLGYVDLNDATYECHICKEVHTTGNVICVCIQCH